MNKPAILMVHGAFGGGWAFENFQQFFEARDYRCIAPDLRHHTAPTAAASSKLAATSLLDYVRDLEELIVTLDGPFVLMGHSMGGLLCQMLAARGHAPAGLVLLAPSPPAGIIPASSMEMLTAFGIFASGMGWGQSSLAPDRYTAAEHALSHIPGPSKKVILDRLSAESGYALFEIMCWMMDAQQASRVDAAKVKCPVLAIAGSHDPINTPDTVRQIARRYGDRAEFHCFEKVSHWLLDGPQWPDIAQHCADWLERPLKKEQSNAAAGAAIGG